MSHIMPRRPTFKLDPLTEHLANLAPHEADALQMMQGVYSNQSALSAAVVAIQRHIFTSDNDIHALAESVAANTLPRFRAVAQELEKQEL